MKFGQQLNQNQFPPWKNEYIQYDELKYFLKARQLNGWTGADELYFSETLLKELDKVNNFIQLKIKQVGSDSRKINDIIQFININDIGFYKIMKKHDKWTGIYLLPKYPDIHQKFQSFITNLNQITRITKPPVVVKPITTTKFWVHLDNLTEVQANLLFHLPTSSTDIINTVYFDNPTNFILYSELLERNEEAEIIRARWYGDTNRDIYFERKIHQESWVHNKGSSTKSRFHLLNQEVDQYLSMGHHNNDNVSKLIFQSMQKKQLKSTLRCYHHRTTYSADPNLRISLDTRLTFIKQESTWNNNDFQHLNRDKVNYFPFAVLEIKTINASIPEWLTQLVESGQLVYEVPYFSKYMHGTSLFFRERLPLLPWWLGEMNIDIRRKSSYATIQSQHSGCIIIEPPPLPDYTSPPNDDDKKIYDNMTSSCTVLDDSQIGLANNYAPTSAYDTFVNSAMVVKIRDMKELYFNDPEGQPRDENYVCMISWIHAKVTNNKALLLGDTIEQAIMPKKGKKKIEPKLFFSNERTFISWLQFSALLLSVSLGLINFGDHVSRASGGFFIVIAMILAGYAQLRFQYRAWQIRFRGGSRFDDVYGPAVLCLVLVIALIVNLALRVNQPLPDHPSPFGYHVNQTVTNDTMVVVGKDDITED